MTKPTFTNLFLRRRCIVPAEAFYEWVGPKGGRQPLSIERTDGKLLSMAGLFNYWRPKDAKEPPEATFTVVTTVSKNLKLPDYRLELRKEPVELLRTSGIDPTRT